MRVTRHNGRSDKNTAKHNERNFDTSLSEHIDENRLQDNIYWDCYQGFRSGDAPIKTTEDPYKEGAYFSSGLMEALYYSEHYAGYVLGQNERNEKARHSERNKKVDDLLHGKRTQPEETILQIGDKDEHTDPEILVQAMQKYQAWFESEFGEHVHILNWSLHLDESTPHIHERHVFDYTNSYGELQPMQEKALEALGIECPDSDKPKGRNNCRKMTFDQICRDKFIEIVQSLDVEIETEPIYGGRNYMEKQDFIIWNQKRQIEEGIQQLEDLNLKISEVETLIDEVTDIAYDRAVDVLSETAAREAHRTYESAIDHFSEHLLKDPKLTEKGKSFLSQSFSDLKRFLQKNLQPVTNLIRRKLHLPETAERVKTPVREAARTSLLARLEEKKQTNY